MTYNISNQFKGKLLEEWLKEPEKPKVAQPTITPSNTTSQGDYWRIENVNYQGKLKNVRLWKQLIPAMNHNKLVEYSLNAKLKGEFYAPNSILNFAVFEALYNSKNSQEKEKARKFIQNSLRKNYPNTLTRIIYASKEKDEIIHNYGIPNEQYSFKEDVVGPDREINNSDKNVLEKILGEKDINKIKEIFKWLNNTPIYIWRLSSKPEDKDERVVGLLTDSGGAYLDCYWGPSDDYPAFGVFED